MTTPMRRLGLITGGVAIFLIAVWYLLLYNPQNHKLATAHKSRAAAEQNISSLNTQVVGLRALERQAPADAQNLEKFTAAVPDNPELPSALDAIQQAATASGVSLTNLSPSNGATNTGSSAAPAGTPEIPVSMNVAGSYSALTAFISALGTMPRTLVIQSINISGSAGTLTASLAADIFYSGQPTP